MEADDASNQRGERRCTGTDFLPSKGPNKTQCRLNPFWNKPVSHLSSKNENHRLPPVAAARQSATSHGLLQHRQPVPSLFNARHKYHMTSEDIRPVSSQSPSTQNRKSRHFVPSCQKDEYYWMKRRKNNEAARKSREKRRTNDLILTQKVLMLLQENIRLKKDLLAVKMKYNEIDPAEGKNLQKRMDEEELLSGVAQSLSSSNIGILDSVVRTHFNGFDLGSSVIQRRIDEATASMECHSDSQSEVSEILTGSERDEPKHSFSDERTNLTTCDRDLLQHFSHPSNMKTELATHTQNLQAERKVVWISTSQPQTIKLQEANRNTAKQRNFKTKSVSSHCARESSTSDTDGKTSDKSRGTRLSERPSIDINLVKREHLSTEHFMQYPIFVVKRHTISPEVGRESSRKKHPTSGTKGREADLRSVQEKYPDSRSIAGSSPNSSSTECPKSTRNSQEAGGRLPNADNKARHLPYKLRFKLATTQSQPA